MKDLGPIEFGVPGDWAVELLPSVLEDLLIECFKFGFNVGGCRLFVGGAFLSLDFFRLSLLLVLFAGEAWGWVFDGVFIGVEDWLWDRALGMDLEFWT